MCPAALFSTAEFHRLGFAGAVVPATERFHVVVAAARGAQVDLPAGWASAWWVLQGSLVVQSPTFQGDVGKGRLLAWQDGPLRLSAPGKVGAIGIAGPAHLWAHRLRDQPGGGDRLLMPWQVRPGRELRRLMLRVARLSRHGQARNDAALGALVAAVHESQAPVRIYLDACSGRTRQRREQVLLRLMRVRHLITFGRSTRLDLTSLAEVANYSPTHLIRLYREVFGETPLEHANRLRVGRSWALVRDTRMPIGDISEVIGFESKSAFCRSFKANFGATTSQVLRAGAA